MKSKRKIITIIPASSCCKAWHSSWWSPCDIQQWSCSPGWILGAYSHIPSSLFLTPSTSVWSPTRLTYASLLSVIHLHQSHFLMQHFIFPHAISFSKFLEICPSKCAGIQEISCWVIDSLSCGPRQSIPSLHMRWAREESPTQCLEEETTNRDNNSLTSQQCETKKGSVPL